MKLWTIEEVTVTEEQARDALEWAVIRRDWFSIRRHMPAGTYEVLKRGDTVVMANSPGELSDLAEFRGRAIGRVLINGLGLGIAARMALDKREVTSVTVIEASHEVIELVAPRFVDDRLRIHQGDAFDWRPQPGERWDVAWHDIWDTICADNLEGMRRLHRKYGRRCAWQGSWQRRRCERKARAERRAELRRAAWELLTASPADA